MRSTALTGLLFAWCWTVSSAQQTRPIKLPIVDARDLRFVRVPFGNGPAPTQVSQIVQDNQGFLWFGTQDGLKRYDGHEVKTYRHDRMNSNSLSGVFVQSMFKDRSGMLWVGSGTSLDRYDPSTDAFTHFTGANRDPAKIDGEVYDIHQDRQGIIWLATNFGLVGVDPLTWRTMRYQRNSSDPDSLSTDSVRSTFEDEHGTFWVGTADGLDIFDRGRGKVTRHFPLHIAGTTLISLLEDHSGVLWVAFTTGEGLASMDPTTGTVTRYSTHDIKQEKSLLAGVNAILEDEDGTLWLGTQGSGLLKLDKNRKQFVRYRNDPSDPDSLSENTIMSMLEDREGNIWVGTGGGGIERFSRKPLPFKSYRHQAGNRDSLANDFVISAFEDSQHEIWVGSRTALSRIDPRSGHFTFYQIAGGGPHNLSNTNVLSIAEDSSGYLWFGTFGGGLNRFDRRTGRFKVYRHDPADPHSLSDDVVGSLFVDHRGTLWAGTDDGLSRFDPVTQQFTTYRINGEDVSRYHGIAEDSDGSLWLASWEAGLRRFDPATDQFVIYRHAADNAGSLSSDRVNTVYIDSASTIWAGTQSGFDRFDRATRTFAAFDEHDGLPNSTIISILEDKRGDLWLGTNNGLSRFSPNANIFRNYYASDGLPGNEFNGYGTAFKASSGEMFFCSYSGLITFFPDRVVDNSYIPPVVLTDFRLFGNPVSLGHGSPLEQPISVAKSIVLSHTQNIFSFEFSALSYASPERNHYRYRLEGLEKLWNEADSNRRFASYSTLSPGDYVFRVQGSNNRGIWNEAGARVRIRILPPWWSTWWLRTIVAASLILILWSAYQTRFYQLAKQFNMRLEERVGERTRIARELHDTLLQSFQGLLPHFQAVSSELAEGEPKQELDKAIDKAARAITEGRDAVQGLRASTVERNDLADSIRALGEELVAAHTRPQPPEVVVQVEGIARDLHPILRDELYRIAGEALRNAFHHAEAQRIETEIRYDERQLGLRVRDDGKGIDQKLLNDNGRTGHFGLHGMKERSKLIGGRLTVWSELESGTEVELSIPAAHAYTTIRNSGGRSWLAEKLSGKDREMKS